MNMRPTAEKIIAKEFIRDVAAAIGAVRSLTKRRTIEADPAGNTYEETYFVATPAGTLEFERQEQRDAAVLRLQAQAAIEAVSIWFRDHSPEHPSDILRHVLHAAVP